MPKLTPTLELTKDIQLLIMKHEEAMDVESREPIVQAMGGALASICYENEDDPKVFIIDIVRRFYEVSEALDGKNDNLTIITE